MNSPLCEVDKEIRRGPEEHSSPRVGWPDTRRGRRRGRAERGRLAAGAMRLSGFEPHRCQVFQTGDSALSQARLSAYVLALALRSVSSEACLLWPRPSEAKVCTSGGERVGRRGSLSSCESRVGEVGTASLLDAGRVSVWEPPSAAAR